MFWLFNEDIDSLDVLELSAVLAKRRTNNLPLVFSVAFL